MRFAYGEEDDEEHEDWSENASELVHKPEARLKESVKDVVARNMLIIEHRQKCDLCQLPLPSKIRLSPAQYSHFIDLL